MPADGRSRLRGATTVVAVTAAVVAMALVWVAQRPPGRPGPEPGSVAAARPGPAQAVVTMRSARPRVLVHAPSRPAARPLLAEGAVAVRTVRRVLPGWTGELVIEVPADQAALERSLAAPPGTYDGIAAVTTRTAEGPVVHLNPAVYDELAPIGRRVVLAHETAHVAAGAGGADLPMWLLEGFADYVALRDVAVPVTESARHQLADVARSGPPTALPDGADFAATGDDLAAAYEGSWLACRLIARRDGEAALVALYESVAAGRPVTEALRRHTSFDTAGLTAAWAGVLGRLAARGGIGQGM